MGLASIGSLASLLQVPVESAQTQAMVPTKLGSIHAAAGKLRYQLLDLGPRASPYNYPHLIVHLSTSTQDALPG